MEYISFPRLDFEVPVSRIAFTVFGLPIYTYAILIAFALVLSMFLALMQCEKHGIRQNEIIDMMIIAIPVAVICARLYFVIFSWDSYRGDFMAMINIRQGGLAIYGAIIGSFAVVVLFSKARKINPLAFLDFAVPYLAMAQAIGRWGNFVNQEAFGHNTGMPWGMTSPEIVRYLTERADSLRAIGVTVDPSAPVHPTFLYESLFNFALAAILFYVRRNKKFHGQSLFVYLAGYGLARAYIEGLRVDSLMVGMTNARVSQILSLLLAVLFFALLLIQIRRNKSRLPWPVAVGATVDATVDAAVDVTGDATGDAAVDATVEADAEITADDASGEPPPEVDGGAKTDEPQEIYDEPTLGADGREDEPKRD